MDYCTFDGAANVQKAAEALAAFYPRIICTHGSEHVISLFFQDCFVKSTVLSIIVNLYRRMYAVFGSGAQHAPYAIFQKYAKLHNGGNNIGLMRAAGTRMAGAAIGMMQFIRLRHALVSTVRVH